MKYLIIITTFLLLPNIFYAQMTYVPDDNFENALIDLGYDEEPLNDSVPTANIDTVTNLRINRKYISDLTGIKDFSALVKLICSHNELTYLDVSNNSDLVLLFCEENKITSLDLSNNAALQRLYCFDNKLTNLDLSNNIALLGVDCDRNKLVSLDLSNNTTLERLTCSENNFTSLDLSKNTALTFLHCQYNSLTSLDIKNGNNKNMKGDFYNYYFVATYNPKLTCIQVDDSAWSANTEKWVKDDHAVYSEDCTKVSVEELNTFEPEISIFPNPADKNFTVSFELETPKTISMTLTDLSGRELQEFSLEHKQFINEKIDVSWLSSGVYFLRIDFGGGSISKKIVVE